MIKLLWRFFRWRITGKPPSAYALSLAHHVARTTTGDRS